MHADGRATRGRQDRPAQSVRRSALEQAWVVVEHELTPNADLFATVARLSKEALLQLAPLSALKKAGQRVASVLAGLEVGYGIAGLRLAWSGDGDVRTSSGDAARDLTELLVGLGEAALEHDRGVAFMFDELQFAPVEPLAAFVTGLHKVAQRSLPLTAVAAGLPQTRGVLAEAVSYSERMFETRTVGALGDADARAALAGPAAEEGVDLSQGALTEAVRFTEGYPFFQVFGDHLWRTAGRSPVT